ncbi:MAG TPA: metallophosphoesterase family protein [Verrucomicrobiae bacterium]|nr:metallophosphoesterase family protein [Verrucomicrobiae bacterium]
MTPQQQVITELLAKFPRAASKTIARIAYKENRKLFLSLESARNAVRYARGASGEKHRKTAADKSNFRAPEKPGNPFAALPEAKTHFSDWEALQIEGPLRVLLLSDLHIPYHDLSALTTALDWAKKNPVDCIILNGDIADFFAVSRWEKNPKKRDLNGEIVAIHKFLGFMHETFPKARKLYKIGNHEERWESYLSVKAPEVMGIPDFEIEKVLRFDQFGIECVGDKRPMRLGTLNVIHGHEYPTAISNPVNPARGFFLRAKAHCIGSHFHQKSQHSEKNIEEKVVSTWSTGCLCDLHPDYRPLNAWNHGFAYVELSAQGDFQVENFTIVRGKVY